MNKFGIKRVKGLVKDWHTYHVNSKNSRYLNLGENGLFAFVKYATYVQVHRFDPEGSHMSVGNAFLGCNCLDRAEQIAKQF